MAESLLLVTLSSEVAESIRRTLQEAGPYQVHVADSRAAAVVEAEEAGSSLAILDLGPGEEWVRDIGESLRTIRPEIKLVVLTDEETPPALDAIRPWALLRKPYHLKELLAALREQDEEAGDKHVDTITWLQDVAIAAQHLTRLTLESSAQAALITRKNELWAYAGGLSQNAGQEVVRAVSRNWDDQRDTDLLRFIRLESTRAEHMLYATRLAPDTVLALVFDAETPFSTIRMQANDLINAISTEKSTPAESRELPLEEELDDEDGIEIPPISTILTDVPSPDPSAAADQATGEEASAADTGETRVSTPLSDATSFPRESAPAVPLRDRFFGRHRRPPQEDFNATVPSESRRRPSTPLRPPEADELAATRLSPTTEAERRIKLEPVSAGLYHLSYACLLVPRFSAHYLTGDLGERLSEWLPTLCVAFGWRLEYLAVRPEYLQWVVNVPPNTSPGYLMRIVRHQTSVKIFKEIPRLRKDNPSGDFWAPGYLIMGGTQPPPSQLVRDYIKQARERQGLLHPQK
ncbi:MAG: transposase [Bacteroidota bacterium]